MPRLTKLVTAIITGRQGINLENWTEIRCKDLAEFPKDVVIEAPKRIRREQKFLPTSSGLLQACGMIGEGGWY